MASIYVRSGAAGAADGSTWANAYVTLAAATAVATSSDTIWVADDHAESTGAAKNFTFPTTIGLKVLCADTHVTEPPTGLAATATITTTGNNAVNFVGGIGYVYGIIFSSGTGASASADLLISSSTSINSDITFDTCKLQVGSSSATAPITIGPVDGSNDQEHRVNFINCSFKFGNVGQSILLSRVAVNAIGITLDAAGSIPTTLFGNFDNNTPRLLVSSSDLSGRAFTNLVNGVTAAGGLFVFRNCKLPASITVVVGTIPNPCDSVIKMHNCDSGATNYRIATADFRGSLVNENTIVRSGGASNGTTTGSWKMVTTASSLIQDPFVSEEIAVWNSATGSALTATVEIVHDSVTNLTDAEVWLEVEYLSSNATPVGVAANDRVASIIGTGTDQTTSAVTWTTTGITNVNKQKLQVTFTPQMAGVVLARVKLAKASYTIYVDPLLTIA